MVKKILLITVFLTIISTYAESADLSVIEEAFNIALSSTPQSYEYNEKSGALFFIQKKNYCFDIVNSDDGLEQIVTYSSTKNEKAIKEDPRVPVEVGDRSSFCMRSLVREVDLFSTESGLNKILDGMELLNGREYELIKVEYCYRDEEGYLWPMEGKLFVDYKSGIPVIFTAEQKKLPEDIYSLSIEVDFDSCNSSACRVSEYRKYERGQYGVFRYKYDTILSFTY